MKIKDLIYVVLIFIILALFAYTLKADNKKVQKIIYVTPTSIPSPTPVSLDADKLFSLVNGWRLNNGLKKLTRDEKLCQFAEMRMIKVKKNFSHDGFVDMAHSGIFPNTYYGENLARRYVSEIDTYLGWINSPEHLANIKANYNKSCIVTDGTYAIQIFANF